MDLRNDGVETYDAIVIGSGFGGSAVAHTLVGAGERVLMLERGDWVARGPENWLPEGVGELTGHYSKDVPYRVHSARGEHDVGGYYCVGGPSVFYGGVSLRFRAEDFEPNPAIAGSSGARWPFAYDELEPYYARAERLIGVAGAAGEDPTEPWRSGPYPAEPGTLAPISERMRDAARSLGLRPFRLPLAIDHVGTDGRTACRACRTCDGFACAIGAKNDLATTVLPALISRGMELRPGTVAVRLHTDGTRVTEVEALERATGRRYRVRGRRVVLAAGALASPHLLLASGLDRLNPGGRVVGRYLMRHYNEIVFGLFPRRPDPDERHHKQIGIHDLYFGAPGAAEAFAKAGGIQQLPTPPVALVRAYLPLGLGRVLTPAVEHLTGLLVIAEDQPQFDNRLALDAARTDAFGMPAAVIHHRYTARDLAAGMTLVRQAKRVLRRAGAWILYRHRIHTFSHAVGGVRMGGDPATSALDAACRYRGLANLWVTDGSFMPTSAGVNPSLTIAANALRAAEAMLDHDPEREAPTYVVSEHR